MILHTRFTLLGLNPNDVGAFLTVLILTVPVLIRWSKHLLWLVCPIEALLIALLVGTGSRGGVLALICGLTVLMILSSRNGTHLRWRMWVAVLLIGLIGVGAGLMAFPKGFRLANLDVSPEASAGRRLEVWATVPAMLASAPNGWGSGKSAEAYEQWFEPVGKEVELKHLLSSHFTWLVEWEWPLRWLYLFFWVSAIALLLPNRKFSFPIYGVAIWTTFLVALLYNASGKWWNWPLPLLWLMVALIVRFQNLTFPSLRFWLSSASVTGLLVSIPFILLGVLPPKIHVQAVDGGNIVVIGSGEPTVALLDPSKEVLGDFYGQAVRKNWSQGEGAVVIVGQPDALAASYLKNCRLYVISGEDETAFFRWRSVFTPQFESKLLLVNCRVQPDDWTKVFGRVTYCHGEFYGDPNYNDWKIFSKMNPAVSIHDLLADEAYVADWWSLVNEALSPHLDRLAEKSSQDL